ncbi:MAG TPA: hypothetical protein VLA89_05595 [Gemmatimonadales bacterium]|nr:hypothetical protein [Gemmatimonadales bacterium]
MGRVLLVTMRSGAVIKTPIQNDSRPDQEVFEAALKLWKEAGLYFRVGYICAVEKEIAGMSLEHTHP